MQTVGTYLKRERESRNISLGEVAQLTKISQFYLDFLEKDDYEKLPQGPYIKGYISSYARLIGSSADEALKLYNSLQEQMKPAEAFQTERPEPAVPAKSVVVAAEEKNGSSIKDRLAAVRSKTAASMAECLASQPFSAPAGKIKAGLQKAASALKAPIPSATAMTSSVRASGSRIGAGGRRLAAAASSLKKFAPILSAPILRALKAPGGMHRLIPDRRAWLYAGGILVGSGILVLAGFGFYHVFIYQKNPLPTAAVQTPHDKDVKPAVAARPEAARVSPSPPPAAPAAIPSVDIKPDAVASLPSRPPTDLKAPPPPAAEAVVASAPVAAQKEAASPEVSSSKSAQPLKSPAPPVKSAPPEAAAGKAANAKSPPQPSPVPPPARPAAANLSIAQASISSAVKDRMPAGASTSFPWSTGRVYVWNLVNAKNYPAKIRHIYYFSGQKISDVELNVRSFSWRTWSYQTIADKRYKGIWQVDIATLDGQVLESLHFEVN